MPIVGPYVHRPFYSLWRPGVFDSMVYGFFNWKIVAASGCFLLLTIFEMSMDSEAVNSVQAESKF